MQDLSNQEMALFLNKKLSKYKENRVSKIINSHPFYQGVIEGFKMMKEDFNFSTSKEISQFLNGRQIWK